MNLYKISQTQNEGYDTYDSAVVAAKDEAMARKIHPDRSVPLGEWLTYCWCEEPKHVKVELIGYAKPGTEPGVICASFNAG